MDCEEALILLSGYLDQSNTEEEMARLRVHLETCPACREVLHTLQEIDRGIAALEEEPPVDLKEAVMAAIGAETKSKRTHHRWLPVAAAAALVLVIGISGMGALPAQKSAEPMAVTADVAPPAVYARTMDMPVSEAYLDTQSVADRLGAQVVETSELLPEMEVCPCETLEDGSLLYQLDTLKAAEDLSAQYDLVLVIPVEYADSEVSYARLLS